MKRSGQLFDIMQRATSRAFDRAEQVASIESDPDLRLYNTLTQQDFSALVGTYGESNVVDYIKAMESKRLMRGGTNAH